MASRKKPAASKNEVVKKESYAPALADEMASLAGAGTEGADADSYAIPFLNILQSNSPQVDEASGEALEGARAGMFFDSVSQKLYSGKEGVVIIPCSFKRSFIHWGSRDGGDGGFKNEYTVDQANEMIAAGTVKEFEGKLLFPMSDGSIHEKKSDLLADTRVHYVLVVDPDTGELNPVVFSLSSTQIKKSKAMMSLIAQHKIKNPKTGCKVQAPAFSNLLRISTIPESNDKGNWFGLRVEREGVVEDSEQFAAGKAFWEQVKSGAAQARYDDAADATGVEAEDEAF